MILEMIVCSTRRPSATTLVAMSYTHSSKAKKKERQYILLVVATYWD
jgi:hypothetical protein